MLDSLLNVKLLHSAIPYLVAISLAVWGLLWLIHCCRLIHHSRPTPGQLRGRSAEDEPTFREMIRHENDLMNHRLTWLMTAEGLLFAALGFALSTDNAAMARDLRPILSFVGILVAASASIALDGADAALVRLSGRAPTDSSDRPDIIGYRGLPYVGAIVGLLAPWRVYPPMFIVAWFLISQVK